MSKYSNFDNIYISSFNYDFLKSVREENKSVKLSWLIDERISESNLKLLKEIGGTQICPNARTITDKEIKLANDDNVEIRFWGVSNEDIMKKVFKYNSSGMTVNFPDKLKLLLDNK